MKKKYDRCVKQVKRKIKQGKIPKTYKKGRKRVKSNPYSICKMTGREFNKKCWGEPRWE